MMLRNFINTRVLRRSLSNVTSSVERREPDFKEGAEIEGFLVNKVASVGDFDMTMIQLRHVRTGCDYLHLARNDANNVFALCFRTTPLNSTGVAHILEHVVLCGSIKYPCRDLLFKLMPRSTANFMNAMTGPDYTLFPFATQNQSDFKNLLAVFADAVFRPRMREVDFRHEGWRFEHETLNDRESPIRIKGVVYDEMKATLSDNSAMFSNALLNHLLPSHTYAFISGGDPKVIPTLTFDELKDFHKKYYHPSNCKIFSYGSFPLVNTLRFINKEYLAELSDGEDYAPLSKVPPETRWEVGKRKHIPCRPDSHKSTIAIASLCNDIRSTDESFAMTILSELLVGCKNCIFQKEVIDAKLGTGYAPGTGYDSQTRDTFFSLGLSGLDSMDYDRMLELYEKILNGVIANGFDEEDVNAALNNLEVLKRHQTANFGLDMLFRITPIWNHDGDIDKTIDVSEQVGKFKKSIKENPKYLQDLVSKYLKNNKHQLVLTMSPDELFASKEADVETKWLEQRLGSFSQANLEKIHSQSLEIAQDVEIKQDSSFLPIIDIAHLSPQIERCTLKGYSIRNVPVQVCHNVTNGLTYLRGVLNASILSEEAKSILPLFCIAVVKMGTKNKNCEQFDKVVRRVTGRFGLATHVAENIYDPLSFEEGITFSSLCMDSNVNEMMELWAETFASASFTNFARLQTIVKESFAGMFHNLASSGDLYAISAASAMISPPATCKERFGGLEFIGKMRELASKTNLSDAMETMQGIKDIVFKKRLIRLAVNTGGSVQEVLQSVDNFLRAIPGEFRLAYDLTKFRSDDERVDCSVHFETAIPSSHAAHCFRTVAYTHDDFPILRIAARLLAVEYCLPHVRDRNCALRSGANLSSSGILSLFSFKDPSPSQAFDAFSKAKSWLSSGREYSNSEITEAKLSVLQLIDAPTPAGSKGIRNFLYGISDDELQRHRKVIIKAGKEDLMRVAELIDTDHQARCLIGPRNQDILCRPSEENWQKRFI